MINRRLIVLLGLWKGMGGLPVLAQPVDLVRLRDQVTATEVAFAQTMVNRDQVAFANFIAEDAVFLNGGKPLRGKAAIISYWKQFFSAPKTPFAWKPDLVEVLASGTLAQSIGPVSGPDGVVFGRFYSTWRLESSGIWRVVFDDGYDLCKSAPQESSQGNAR